MKYFIAESIMTEPCPVTGEEMKSTYVPAHVAHLHRGIDAGMLLMGGPNEFGGGFLLLKADSREEVMAFLEKDPFRTNGINRFRLTEFFPNDRSEMVKDW